MAWDSRVVWSEGMFLRTQHFQQHDRYVERLVSRRVGGLVAHGWGVEALQIDRDLLAIGKFALASGYGVMRDGTPFVLPEDAPPPMDVPENARDAFARIKSQEIEAFVVPGGNFPTMSFVPAWEREFGKPVITTNQAAIWAMMQIMDAKEKLPGLGRLLEEMPAR